MTLVWKNPPNGRRVFTNEVLEELRGNPGTWALIRSYPYSHGRHMKPPPADIEIRWVVYGHNTDHAYTELYARARPRRQEGA